MFSSFLGGASGVYFQTVRKEVSIFKKHGEKHEIRYKHIMRLIAVCSFGFSRIRFWLGVHARNKQTEIKYRYT